MSKIAIATDSNSGITKDDAAKLGVFVLPMPFYINNELFLEEITLTQEQFFERLKEDGVEIKTSAPLAGDLMDFWDKLLEEYDQVVYIPMSSGLSGSCQTAKSLALDYEGKVFVVDNQRVSVIQRQSVVDAKMLADAGKSAQEIHDTLMEYALEASIYIMVDTLYYLKKGGRITPAAAAFGTVLRIKPILQIQGEKLDAFARARTINQAKTIMINQIRDDSINRYGTEDTSDMHLLISHSDNREEAELFKKEVLEAFPRDPDEIVISPLSLSVSCHIGAGSLSLQWSKAIPVD